MNKHALNREPVPLKQMDLISMFALCGYTTQSILRTFRVFIFTKIRDRIKNPDHHDFSLRKETMYPKKDYFSFIFIETTHNIDGILEKE